MKRRRASRMLRALTVLALLPGCSLRTPALKLDEAELEHYKTAAVHIDYPDVQAPPAPGLCELPSPQSIGRDAPVEYWELPLVEAIRLALSNSKVLGDAGGVVLQSPTNARTVQSPAIAETDPRFGVAATLSAFDAQFATKTFFAKNHQAINNIFFGGGTRVLQQDTYLNQIELSKRTATGGTVAVRNITDYDANNAPGNLFPHAWNSKYEFEARQPWLQGAGAEFNRIYGPPNVPGVFSGVPGFANGVMVARINTDISLTELEAGVRDLVSNVENAYWDLYFAYRDLDAKIAARDSALETWRRVHALFLSGRRGGEAEKEAEAREQYFRFQEEVQIGWYGRLVGGTNTFNGSGGGTLRTPGGVRTAERRLRMLMGLPISDSRLIRPGDEPRRAPVVFDWEPLLKEALVRRVELRKQKWVIKRRELELLGSKNFLLPNLDTVALYRFRGFGENLINFDNSISDNRYDNALQNMASGQFQEWQAGFEFSAPLGFRRGHAAVRNAELQLAREKCILAQQEREVALALSNAVAEVDRAFQCTNSSYNRLAAARQHLAAVSAAFEADKAQSELVLDSQRRLAEADIRYFGSIVEYALAIKNVHFEKGSLLDYNEVFLAEGPWPGKAYDDAAERDANRLRQRNLNYVLSRPQLRTSAGAYPQLTSPTIEGPMGPPGHMGEPILRPTPITPAPLVPTPPAVEPPLVPSAPQAGELPTP